MATSSIAVSEAGAGHVVAVAALSAPFTLVVEAPSDGVGDRSAAASAAGVENEPRSVVAERSSAKVLSAAGAPAAPDATAPAGPEELNAASGAAVVEVVLSPPRRRSAPSLADSVADRVDVDAALQAVPVEFRAAVVLRDVCGLDYAEIAEVLAIPPGTVRSRIARGRALIARRLGGNQSVPPDRLNPSP